MTKIESFIRDNFAIKKNEAGEEYFEYEFEGATQRTKLSSFLENNGKFNSLLEYWESEDLDVPEH